MTLKEMREKQRKLVDDARAKLDEIADDTSPEQATEIEQSYDAIMAEHDRIDERAAREEQLEKRQREAEEREERGDDRRPRGEDRGGEREDEQDAATYDQAFRSYVANGMGDIDPEHRKLLRENRAQSVGTDNKGGFLVPQGFLAELVMSMAAYSPMFDESVTRQLVTATGNNLEIPTEDDTANEATLIAEATAVAESDVTLGQISLDAYKYTSGLIKVSSELMQDAAINPEQIVRNAMATRFGRGIGKALTIGDGVGKPNGIVTAAGAGVTAAGAAAITFDELIDLQHSIDPAYRNAPSVGWMFHDDTFKLLRKIKDGDGNYIWQPASVQTGAPASLLGDSYRINQAMSAPSAGARTVLYGDMQKYVTRRVRDVAIRRLDERYAESDQTAFVGFARVDGEILDAAAIKALTQA